METDSKFEYVLYKMEQDQEGKKSMNYYLFYIRYYIVQPVLNVFTRLNCKIKGHMLVDDDPGDCEVGPQPDVYCERCGKQFR